MKKDVIPIQRYKTRLPKMLPYAKIIPLNLTLDSEWHIFELHRGNYPTMLKLKKIFPISNISVKR